MANDDVNNYKMVVEHLITKMQELITKYIQKKILKALMKLVR